MTTKEILNSLTHEEGISLFNSKQDDKAVYELFVKKGLTDSYETFVSEVQEIVKEILSQKSMSEIMEQLEGAELSDEQLQAVAGGCGDPDVVEKTVPVAGVLVVSGAVAGAMW